MNDGTCGDGEALRDHAIIAGFGVPGRAVADILSSRHTDFCVVELNPATVERCSHVGVHIISGDVCDEQTLVRAGVKSASLLVLAVPNDPTVLEAVKIARRLNPSIRILARCRYISSGMEAHRLGADLVVVEEQAVAREFERLMESSALAQLAASAPDAP